MSGPDTVSQSYSYGFMLDYAYPMWVSSRPTEDADMRSGMQKSHWDVVRSEQISAGIEMVIYRCAIVRINVHGDPPRGKEEAYRRGATYLRYMNCFSFCMNNGLEAVANMRMNFVWVGQTQLYRWISDDLVPNYGPSGGIPDLDPTQALVGTISNEVVDYAVTIFRKLVEGGSLSIEVGAILNQAGASLSNGDRSSAVVQAWTASEVLLNKVWRDYHVERIRETTGGEPTISRLEKLTGRDYTASVISEILVLAGAVPDDLKIRLDAARQARNSWAHSTTDPAIEKAEAAFVAACDLFEHVTKAGVAIRASAEGMLRPFGFSP